eukprot:CAMPEP_0204294298 /NCGR_PEP_ID=MMETSP0468-20130131/67729_1 /ASSEMBLY_ACC=CAM_ASM_000383 /TAXON_ID=2969 /ORGANISM="Oxyrrhis marina" /LENGTH=66 /DNA_ID=CAMNT_0051272843 /DNA_START=446 /DNA_END=646 /DNA_ORIENTATION=+
MDTALQHCDSEAALDGVDGRERVAGAADPLRLRWLIPLSVELVSPVKMARKRNSVGMANAVGTLAP